MWKPTLVVDNFAALRGWADSIALHPSSEGRAMIAMARLGRPK